MSKVFPIPEFLREASGNPDLSATIITQYLGDYYDFESSFYFVRGYLNHQAILNDPSLNMKESKSNLGWKWMARGKVVKITDEKRGKAGTKKVIHFKANRGDGGIEEITTGWYSKSFGVAEDAWEIALSHQIVADAETAMKGSHDVIILKYIYSGFSKKQNKNVNMRHAIDLRVIRNADEEEAATPKDDILTQLESVRGWSKINEDDQEWALEFFTEVPDATIREVDREIKDELGIKKFNVKNPSDNSMERFVQILLAE